MAEGWPSHLEARKDLMESDRYGDMIGECHRCLEQCGQRPWGRKEVRGFRTGSFPLWLRG